MNQKALKTLEFDKIIHILTAHAASEGAKEMCRKLVPYDNINDVERAQRETADALRRVYRKGSVSFGGIRDIRGSLKRLEIGGILGMGELLQIMSLLETAGKIRQYGQREADDTSRDSLDESFEFLDPVPTLASEIRHCILADDEMSDDASSALLQIRRSMRQMNDKVHNTLNSMVNGSARSYLQDPVVTMRDGRYCLPVRAEHRSQVPGMIHDQSSTGSTLFIEPMAVIKLNNDFKELLMKEQQEIEKILSVLSEKAAAVTEILAEDYRILTALDFIFARAMMAKDMKATRPIFNTDRQIHIKDGRHPLLDPKKAVPITVRLGDDFDLLIITGPNTGGKTVSLKTVGLFTLMGQAGLHIPAFEGSRLAVFDQVYADIGDEQSIEQSLSTFSSHMTTIVSILKEVTLNSLVLFDELGAGTDPTEGAALATSILDHLHRQGIRAMATTHYSELKVYALSTEGVENACCEFDVETLRPTYRLLIGVPGKSNAFAISSKLGLPDYIIDKAKEQISEQDESFEDVLSSLESSRITIENERREIEQYKQEIASLKSEMESKQEKLNEQRDRIIRQANEEAHAVLREAKEYADQTMKMFHKFQKDHVDLSAVEKERQNLRKHMNKAEKGMTQKTAAKKPKKELTAKDISLGDAVKVLSMNLKGTVSSRPDNKGFLFVQMGIIRSKVHISDLELIDEAEITTPTMQRTGAGKIRMSKAAHVSTEINLLGKTVDEAVAELDKYLDDAYIAHLKSVRIVHGKGTGALRKGVHNYLKRQKHVESFRLGEFGEGDAGVTIVEFKK